MVPLFFKKAFIFIFIFVAQVFSISTFKLQFYDDFTIRKCGCNDDCDDNDHLGSLYDVMKTNAFGASFRKFQY